MLLIVDVVGPELTVKGHVFDGVPADPLRTWTVNEPTAKTAAPPNWVAVRVSPETTQAVLVEHPGPRKNTSALEVL